MPRRKIQRNLADDPNAIDRTGRIVIAGGAGFLGHALSRVLEQDGHEVVILSRRPAPNYGKIRTVIWDGRTVGDWQSELDGADAVVNLTGRSVACLYTPEHKEEIMASRIDSVRAIAEASARCAEPPLVHVQASSLAIYGDAGDRICDESAPHGLGFSVEVCETWENEFFSGTGSARKVALRIGFVLGREGGALKPLANLARCYLGGAAGDGQQYISWLHLHDFCAMVRWVLETPEAEGVFNATGVNPVTNEEFMRTLRQVLKRPWSPRVPVWAVKFGARYIMRADPSLALTGRRCVPRKLLAGRFRFQHPDLQHTLWELLMQDLQYGG